MTLSQLFESYGWQLALIGFFGTFVVTWLKTPAKAIVARIVRKKEEKKVEVSEDQTFDMIAFLLGFTVAILLGSLYTLIASKLGWIVSTEEKPVAYDFALYLSNVIGVWLYQISYYQIWKKLGLKRLVATIIASIKARFDKNNNGKIDFQEAAEIVQGLLTNGKLSIEDVLAIVAKTAPEAANDAVLAVQKEAGTAGVVSLKENTDKLDAAVNEILSKIPQEKLAKVATVLTKQASASIAEAISNDSDSNPVRPTIKF